MKEVRIVPVGGIPEVVEGASIPELLLNALRKDRIPLANRDVIVVKQKIVSKSEGRLVSLSRVRPGERGSRLALELGKDPRLVELVLRESVRVVRKGHGVIITQTRHGFVCANSGVDQSNVPKGFVALLPLNPDSSARKIRKALEVASGKELAVIVTDTFGRPWRRGQTDVAIGCSGIQPLVSYKGRKDKFGYELRVTEPAIVDEIAGAAELVLGKLSRSPIAVVRGAHYQRGEAGARTMVMDKRRDLFR